MPVGREPMTGVDLAWLRMERATNPMIIVGVLTFKQRLNYDSLRAVLEARLLRFARFKQIPVHEALGSFWQAAPEFSLERHCCRLKLARGRHALEAAAA